MFGKKQSCLYCDCPPPLKTVTKVSRRQAAVHKYWGTSPYSFMERATLLRNSNVTWVFVWWRFGSYFTVLITSLTPSLPSVMTADLGYLKLANRKGFCHQTMPGPNPCKETIFREMLNICWCNYDYGRMMVSLVMGDFQ